jgi:pyruvate dehydrogenase E1 component beta subunit
MRKMKFTEAIESAISQAMTEDPGVIMFGEDVELMHLGLTGRFGTQRVRSTPISESAFLGMGVGAAMGGLRPVVEIMLVDFAGVAFDGILNHASKLESFSGGRWNLPLVVKASCGGGYGDGGQHEQNLWALFAHIPGIRVAVPSNPADAGNLMYTSILSDGPVVFLEHKLLSEKWLEYMGSGGRKTVSYDIPPEGRKGEVPSKWSSEEPGKARILREGKDITLISLAVGAHRCMEAAELLSGKGTEAEVIDLRWVVPLDRDLILESVKKTGKLLVVDEDYESFGLTGEVAALLSEQDVAFKYRRVATKETIPYFRKLEDQVLPNVDRILKAAEEIR